MDHEEQDHIDKAVSEPINDESQEESQEEPKMVPLAALEAERRKRQYAESKLMAKEEKEPEEDLEALVEKKVLRQESALTKREILEQVYQDMNPEGVRQINKYLQPILERKPWLADSIDTATNRYARAHEIVSDYLHLVEEKPQRKPEAANFQAQKIVQNSQKPRSPVEIGKSQQPGGAEYLRSIQGKKEFREYRQKVLRGDA